RGADPGRSGPEPWLEKADGQGPARARPAAPAGPARPSRLDPVGSPDRLPAPCGRGLGAPRPPFSGHHPGGAAGCPRGTRPRAAAAAPAHVIALAEGGLKAMFLSKAHLIAVVLLTALLLGTGAGLLLSQPVPQAPAKAGQPSPEKKDQARTDLQGDPLPAGAVA